MRILVVSPIRSGSTVLAYYLQQSFKLDAAVNLGSMESSDIPDQVVLKLHAVPSFVDAFDLVLTVDRPIKDCLISACLKWNLFTSDEIRSTLSKIRKQHREILQLSNVKRVEYNDLLQLESLNRILLTLGGEKLIQLRMVENTNTKYDRIQSIKKYYIIEKILNWVPKKVKRKLSLFIGFYDSNGFHGAHSSDYEKLTEDLTNRIEKIYYE